MQPGILKGVDEIIDQLLGVASVGTTSPHYGHKKACDQLHRVPLKNFAAADLMKQVYAKIKKNWEERPPKEPPSKENWRFQQNRNIDKDNESLEIQLQRAIVSLSPNMWPDVVNWANHVPTASGLWDHKCDKHRAIDLVHVCPGQNTYDIVEFIELKVDRESGHPVYAALEVLRYGVLYVFSRRHFEDLNYDVTKQPLLQVKTIHLVVLAPCQYYEGYQFEWFEREITKGLKEFIQESEGYTMDFQFQAFPREFSAEKGIRDGSLIKEALLEVAPVAWTV